jgi:hypothetical protein
MVSIIFGFGGTDMARIPIFELTTFYFSFLTVGDDKA